MTWINLCNKFTLYAHCQYRDINKRNSVDLYGRFPNFCIKHIASFWLLSKSNILMWDPQCVHMQLELAIFYLGLSMKCMYCKHLSFPQSESHVFLASKNLKPLPTAILVRIVAKAWPWLKGDMLLEFLYFSPSQNIENQNASCCTFSWPKHK